MRILLIEDHPIVRAGCRRILESAACVEVVEAASAAEGLHLSRMLAPDVVVLDLKLPDGNGLDVLRQLLADSPERIVIVFSMYDDPAFAARALECGAKGYISKNDDPDVFLQAIARTRAGGVFLTASMAEKLALMALTPASDPVHALSERERQVLTLLGQGKTLVEIAEHLKVSYRTSASITAQIKGKLNIATTAALIKWAVDQQRVLPAG
ncbi:MAG: response regulator [Acetobacteraceae bacterium]